MNRLAIDDRATGRRATIEDPDLTQTNNHGDGSKVRHAAQQVAVDAQDRDIFSVEEFAARPAMPSSTARISAGARAIMLRMSPVAASRSSNASRSRSSWFSRRSCAIEGRGAARRFFVGGFLVAISTYSLGKSEIRISKSETNPQKS